MAVFQYDKDYQNLDYRLLQESTVSLYLNADILVEDISWLEAHGYRIDAFDCSKWSNELEMHKDFFARLDFPNHFAKNIDALRDCIGCLEVGDAGGRVLVFHRFDVFAAKFPELALDVLDIIELESRSYLLTGKRFIALVQSNNQRIKLKPFGCHEIRLSPRERKSFYERRRATNYWTRGAID